MKDLCGYYFMIKPVSYLMFMMHSHLLALDADKPLHFEVIAGIRSSYVHRGIKLANTTQDFQFNGALAYGDARGIDYGMWYSGETNTGQFTESGVTMRYLEKMNQWTSFVGLQYRDIKNSFVSSGFELDAGVNFDLNADNALKFLISYDTSANGWYSVLEYKGFADLDEDSFFSYSVGVSCVNGYYGGDGFNDVNGRLSYTYNVNDAFSISPYLGYVYTSERNGDIFGGVWFEFSF